MALSIVGLLALGYLSIVVLVFFGQDRLLLQPSRISAETAARDAQRLGLTQWIVDGAARGWLGTERGRRGTALVMHGNSGTALDRQWYVEALRRLDLTVVLLEYPGFGDRGAQPGALADVLADAEQALAAAVKLAPEQPFYLIGESFGAGVAARLAGAQRDLLSRVVLITPWASLQALAARHYPWLPTRWMLRDPMDSAAALRGFNKPVTVVVAQHDRIIPPAHGEALAAQIGADLERIGGATHNDWMAHIDARFWARVLALAADKKAASAPAAAQRGLGPSPARRAEHGASGFDQRTSAS